MRVKIYFLTLFLLSLTLSARSDIAFPLYDKGTRQWIDYEEFGYYVDAGKPSFEYQITNRAGLIAASGEGVDPCNSVNSNPDFCQMTKAGKLDCPNVWKRVNSGNPQLDYFVWTQAAEEPGIRALFVGKALEKGGHYYQALKAYRASMILFPDSSCWSSGGEFQWSSAEACWNATVNLLRKHPEMNLSLIDCEVSVVSTPAGLQVSVQPGRLVRADEEEEKAVPTPIPPPEGIEIDQTILAESAPIDPNVIIQQRGTGIVQLVQYADRSWKMFVQGKEYFIHGLCYAPVKVGEIPWEWDWTWGDDNTNGIVDLFEIWVDKNNNNHRDENEPLTTDGQLLKELGCNTIKLYITDPELPAFNILLFRRLYAEFGIRVIVGNFLGAYCHGSGADWDAGTDYTLRVQKEAMLKSVTNMVEKLKNEPWVLAWILGNENNMASSETGVNATRTNAGKYPETFARFLNEVAKAIHEIDPNHPVGIGNLMTGLVDYYGRFAPEIDFLGANSYLGEDGFGATWEKVRRNMNRPVVITEFGCDSYWTERGIDEGAQGKYLVGNWKDIAYNSAGHKGVGNSIGGFVFEWVDEWWKHTINYFEDSPGNQCIDAVFPMPFPDGYAQEEWFGITSQGNGKNSPFSRALKKSYWILKEEWATTRDVRKGGADH